jgi:hypothetical protein
MAFLSRSPRSQPLASRTAPRPRISNPWHAVSVRSSRSACPACVALSGLRFLSAEAPRLPVAGCARPLVCRAVYEHHDSRRAGPRRESNRQFGADERRAGRGRRLGDARR